MQHERAIPAELAVPLCPGCGCSSAHPAARCSASAGALTSNWQQQRGCALEHARSTRESHAGAVRRRQTAEWPLPSARHPRVANHARTPLLMMRRPHLDLPPATCHPLGRVAACSRTHGGRVAGSCGQGWAPPPPVHLAGAHTCTRAQPTHFRASTHHTTLSHASVRGRRRDGHAQQLRPARALLHCWPAPCRAHLDSSYPLAARPATCSTDRNAQ